MESGFDSHHAEQAIIRRLETLGKLPYGNGLLLKRFIEEYRFKKKPLSANRKLSYVSRLSYFFRLMNRKIARITADDLKEFCKLMQKDERGRQKAFSMHTWRSEMKDLRVFTRWLMGKEAYSILEDSKDEMAVQNPYTDPQRLLSKDDMISEEQFLKLLGAADMKGKAALALIYGCGNRPCEVLSILRTSIQALEDGSIIVSVFGKTGPREIKLRKDLAFYVLDFMNNVNLGPALFYKKDNVRMDYGGFTYMLHSIAVKAGYGQWERLKDKTRGRTYSGLRIYSTMFRRSATTWSLKHMTNALACTRMWGNPTSEMTKIYSRLTPQDAHDAYDEATGQKKKTAQEEKVKGRVCFKCQEYAPVGFTSCPKCGINLDFEKYLAAEAEKEQKQDAQTMKIFEALWAAKMGEKTVIKGKDLKVRV